MLCGHVPFHNAIAEMAAQDFVQSRAPFRESTRRPRAESRIAADELRHVRLAFRFVAPGALGANPDPELRREIRPAAFVVLLTDQEEPMGYDESFCNTSSSRRILVVDDDEDLRDVMMEFLRTLGHEASGAASANQAVEMATAYKPEIAFIDFGLPDATGQELARALRAIAPPSGIRLIALTGLGAEAVGRHAVEDFDHFITKPCSAHRIAAVLNGFRIDTARDDDHKNGLVANEWKAAIHRGQS